MSPGDCSLCRALEGLKAALHLAEPLRRTSSALLSHVVRLMRATPLESHTDPFILSKADTAELLLLSSNPVWKSVDHIRVSNRQGSPAAVLFTALHAADVAAFASDDEIGHVLSAFAVTVVEDDAGNTAILALAVALVPIGVLHSCVCRTIASLIVSRSYGAASAIAAVALARTDTLLSRLASEHLDKIGKTERFGQLLTMLSKTIAGAGGTAALDVHPALRALQIEVNAMASPRGTANVVLLGRTLSALFYEGSHTTLLVPQLKAVHDDSLQRVGRDLLNALGHLQVFAELTECFQPTDLLNARAGIVDAIEHKDCGQFSSGADVVLAHWTQLRETYFYTLMDLADLAICGLQDSLELVADVPGNDTWFDVAAPPSSLRGWNVMGPESVELREHFMNLFQNTFKHAPPPLDSPVVLGDRVQLLSGATGRIGRIDWRVDAAARELVIVYSQRVPFKTQTPSGRGLMSHTTAHLNMFGGGITIPEIRQEEHFAGQFPFFAEVCLTRMPLILEKPRC